VVFVAGAGPHRAIDPWTTETAERAAASGLTTVVYDRLGRGESPAEGRIGIERELAVLTGLIERVGGRAVLCGHSSGCWISAYAATQDLPVAGLMLWEAPLGPPDGSTAAWIGDYERLMDAGDLDGALATYMRDMPPEWLEGARRSPDYDAILAGVPSMRADGEAMVWSASAPMSELLASVAEQSLPIEVAYGEETYPEMLVSADAICAAVPNAIQRSLPGANHAWVPEAMAAELVTFVEAAMARV
jgi:pimeloyl-ACP methyl ester carboxylesterase